MTTPEDDDLPGLPQRYAPLILLYPALILVGIGVNFVVPGLPEWLPFLAAFLIASTILGVVAIRDSKRKRRKAGLVPKRKGFSAEVEVLAAKLRERANETEQAIAFGRPISSAITLQDYLNEVRTWASRQDHREIVSTLRVFPYDPDHEAHIRKLRQSADELDAYAVEIRQRPRDTSMDSQAAGCSAISVAIGIAGIWLVWHRWLERGPGFWWGVALVVIAVIFIWLIRMVQTEPA
jgi:hypothetical protein